MSDTIDHNDKQTADHLERQKTAGNHFDDRSQPGFPVIHRTFASPAPLGLLSFATGIFLVSVLGLNAHSIGVPNILLGVLIFFGGIGQFAAGVMEFMTGNTFGTTLFPAYSAFNLSYAMIYLPGSGITASYADSETGVLEAQFYQALAIYIWAWFILTVLSSVAAIRSSHILFLDLVILSVCLLLLACGNMVGKDELLTAGYSFSLVVAF